MTILIIAAHPDDEVLGAGGLAAKSARAGVEVRACILSGDVDARNARPELERLRRDTLAAQRALGIGEPIVGRFPNIAFNTVPHLELVQFIEEAIRATRATTIVTHHPGDLNDDHFHTARATLAAARLFQRQPGIPALERLLYMEVLSSTEWAAGAGGSRFEPTWFVTLSEEELAQKLGALACYQGVMRPFPHPRSNEALRALATLRGVQAGCPTAEAYQLVFECMGRG